MSIIGFILAPLSLFVGFLFVGCYILFLIFRFLPVAMTVGTLYYCSDVCLDEYNIETGA